MELVHKKVDIYDVKKAFLVFLGREPEDESRCISHAKSLMNFRQLQHSIMASAEYQSDDRASRQRKIELTPADVERSLLYILMRHPKHDEVEDLLSRFTNLFELNDHLLASEEYGKRLQYLRGPGTSRGVKIMQSKSIPRSGHHMLQRFLVEYFQNEMGYCEFYRGAREGCCKSHTCTKAYDPLLGNSYYLQKSHDRDLSDPLLDDQYYIVQYRHPVVTIMSDYSLYLNRTGFDDTKAAFVSFYNLVIQYRMGFLEKWCSLKQSNVFHLRYEDILANPGKALYATVAFITGGEVDKTRFEKALWIMDYTDSSKPFTNRNPMDFPYFDKGLFQEAEHQYLEMGQTYGFPAVSLYNIP